MAMSYSVVPTASNSQQANTSSTANSLGVHDSLRYGGPRSLSAESTALHPAQVRSEKWSETQDQLKFTLQRNLYGMHAPIRQMMERKLVSYNPSFPALGLTDNVHLDILRGTDESIGVEDVLISRKEEALGGMQAQGDMHAAMERRFGI